LADLAQSVGDAALSLYCPIRKLNPVQVSAVLASALVPGAGISVGVSTVIGGAVDSYLSSACDARYGPPNPPPLGYDATDASGIEYVDVTFEPLNPANVIPQRSLYGCLGDVIVSFRISELQGQGSASDFYSATRVRRSGAEESNGGIETRKGSPRPTFTYKSCSGGGSVTPGGGYPPLSAGDQNTVAVLAPILAALAGLGLASAAGVAAVLAGQAALAAEIGAVGAEVAALAAEVAACCAEQTALLIAIKLKADKIDLETDGLNERLRKIDIVSEHLERVLGFGTNNEGIAIIGRDEMPLATISACIKELYSILGFSSKEQTAFTFGTEISVASLKDEFILLRTKMGYSAKYNPDIPGKPPVPESKQPRSIEAVVRGLKLGEKQPIYDTQNFLADGNGSILEIRPDQDFREISVPVDELGVYAFVSNYPDYIGREVEGELRYDFGSYRYTENSPGTPELLLKSQGPRYPLVYTRQYIPGGPQGTMIRFKAIRGVRLRFTLADLEENKPS
jgi:hypothetical protein